MKILDMSLADDFTEAGRSILDSVNHLVVKNVSQCKSDDERGFSCLINYLDGMMSTQEHYGKFYIDGITDRIKGAYSYDEDDDDIKGYYTVIYYPLTDKLIAVRHNQGWA